jgi:type II secretory pathway pseudopilin PulG
VIELCAAIAIVGFLAALVLTGWQTFALQAAKVACMTNMRAIHGALAAARTDLGYWPQVPEFDAGDSESYETWWIAQLEPYGIPEKSWLCPVLMHSRVKDATGYTLRMHYIPTDFDANPISPTRWSTMPWLLEQGNNHGRGALMAFPDGSIHESLK